MNTDVIRILRRRDLERKIYKLRKILQKKERNMHTIESSCKHEVYVYTECVNFYEHLQKCLFCGKESDVRHAFEGGKCIDVSNYKEENNMKNNEKFNMVTNLYIAYATANPSFSIEEIADLVIYQLRKEDDEFKRKMNIFHSKVNTLLNSKK